jgi:hypothetical protein
MPYGLKISYFLGWIKEGWGFTGDYHCRLQDETLELWWESGPDEF